MADGVPFGNYRLQRRLARGGMAEVFLARLLGVEGFERRVAIKRILPHLSESEEFRVMFLDEARLAAQLTHPNVVHIYDFGKVDDYYFIAMEYVDGIDLGRIIRQARANPVPFEFAARMMADVCAGLHYAHNIDDGKGKKLNLVHRDITPQNVLVTYDGVVKIVDFGIAKATWSAGRTRPGVVKGKFAYMSPEQVEGRSLDGRSDVFSLGICMYELLTGVPLFRRDDVKESMREIRDGKEITPERFRADVPEQLVSILRKALATSRDARYASASAMQLDLERFLKTTEALGSSVRLAEYLKREFPRPAEDAPAATGGGTQAQPAGTQAQAVGTQAQSHVRAGTEVQPAQARAGTEAQERATSVQTPRPLAAARSALDAPVDESGELDATTPGKNSARPDPGYDEDEPTLNSQTGPNAPTRISTAPQQRAAAAAAFDRPRSSNTAVVPPLAGSGRRAVVAAAVAAATALLVTLLALRPWRSQAAPPIVVEEQVQPETKPVTTQLPQPSPVAVAPKEPPQPAAPLPEPELDILSRPAGAHVTVDGRSLRTATPVRDARLAIGTHRVLVERKGFQPRELEVQLGEGEHRTLDVELHPLLHHGGKPQKPSGYLTVRSVPWAKVFEGAHLLGTTPMANVTLAEGTHVLTFVNPDLPEQKRTVVIKAGEEARISVELKP